MAAPMEHEMSVACTNDNPETEHPLQVNPSSYPSVVERYFTAGYIADMNGRSCEDFCILKHSNKVCLVTVAKGHPILQPNKEIVKVDFQVGANTNRMQNKVVGKRKKGGQWLNQTAQLCKVLCSDDSSYTMFSCINAKLIEVNEKLLDHPELLQSKPGTEGYVAIVLPKLGGCDHQMEKLLTADDYGAVLKERLETNGGNSGSEGGDPQSLKEGGSVN